MQTPDPGTHLLTNLEDLVIRADTGKRFLNYLIDVLAFYAFLFCIGIVWALISPESLEEYSNRKSILDSIISLFLYAAFMFTQEAIFKGRSIGKFITGTRAVNLDGSPVSLTTILYRSLARAVPLAAFSALGSPCNPWHDRWTDTIVMDIKQSSIIDQETYPT